MIPLTCLTGSYPPLHDALLASFDLPEDTREATIQSSIERAVQDQLEAGIDILVDGQVRDDIIALFLPQVCGCTMHGADYVVDQLVRPSPAPITLADFRYARSLAPDRPFKAHVTAPTTLARVARVPSGPYKNNHDPKFVLDLAEAVAEEARYLIEAGADILQIDDPALVHGVELDLAFQALELIVRKAHSPVTWLHACGDIRGVFASLVEHAPVQAINVEGSWLDYPELAWLDGGYLAKYEKKLCFGLMRVDQAEEPLVMLQRTLKRAMDRFGAENIPAVTPNCGLRSTQYELARSIMQDLVLVVRQLNGI